MKKKKEYYILMLEGDLEWRDAGWLWGGRPSRVCDKDFRRYWCWTMVVVVVVVVVVVLVGLARVNRTSTVF